MEPEPLIETTRAPGVLALRDDELIGLSVDAAFVCSIGSGKTRALPLTAPFGLVIGVDGDATILSEDGRPGRTRADRLGAGGATRVGHGVLSAPSRRPAHVFSDVSPDRFWLLATGARTRLQRYEWDGDAIRSSATLPLADLGLVQVAQLSDRSFAYVQGGWLERVTAEDPPRRIAALRGVAQVVGAVRADRVWVIFADGSAELRSTSGEASGRVSARAGVRLLCCAAPAGLVSLWRVDDGGHWLVANDHEGRERWRSAVARVPRRQGASLVAGEAHVAVGDAFGCELFGAGDGASRSVYSWRDTMTFGA